MKIFSILFSRQYRYESEYVSFVVAVKLYTLELCWDYFLVICIHSQELHSSMCSSEADNPDFSR